MSIDDQLRTLTKNEITVLFYKCKGVKYVEIGDRLGYSVDWVTLQMGGVYIKLGFKKEMHWTERTKILEKEVCPRLPKKLEDWNPVIEITEESTEEIREEPVTNPELMALVVYDEQQIEAVKNASLIHPKPKETIVITKQGTGIQTVRRIFFAGVGLLFIGVSLIIILAIVYFAYRLGRGATPPPDVIVITTTALPATDTSITVPTDPPTPDATATQAPTNTAVPAEFIPPADGILFEDTFDGTIKPEWTQNSGVWIVVDGRLTLSANENFNTTTGYDWITLEDLGWDNYIVSVDVFIPRSNSNGPTAIVVRSNGSGEIGFATDYSPDLFMAFVGRNGYSTTEAIASQRDSVDFPEGQSTKVEMEVQNDTYVLSFNGKEIQRITIPEYDQNLIQIAVHCWDTFVGCASFDNFKVTYLP
jgi:hypothetical protein